MKTEIRPARLSEAAELSAMMRRTFLAANGHCSTPENVAAFVAQAYTPERQAQEIRDPDTLTLIVEQDGVWAGFAQLRWGTLPPTDVGLQPTVELARIYLDEAFHGRGIAAVLDALRAAAPVATGAEVTLEANPGTLTGEHLAGLRAGGRTGGKPGREGDGEHQSGNA